MANTDEIRWQQRLGNFERALIQLESACRQTVYSDLERAGLVQMFEFTFELSWNTLKDLLFYEGFETKTPRATFRKAFEVEYLTEADTETFLDALSKRNILSHTYNEATAKQAETLIKNIYALGLRRLFDNLKQRQGL